MEGSGRDRRRDITLRFKKKEYKGKDKCRRKTIKLKI